MKDFARTGLIGHPVSQSKSPMIHAYWMRLHGLDGAYDLVDLAPEDLEAGFSRLRQEHYRGFNVTVPYKVAVMDLCDKVDDTAQAIGAVNTVLFQEGRSYGMNTDVYGFVQNILQEAPGFDFAAGPSLVLGAGGAARAAVYGLIQAGAPEIRICNRTREKAEEIARNFANAYVRVLNWHDCEENLRDVNLMVNTTSLGMNGKDALEMRLDGLPQGALVHDIVYAPMETDLLQDAKARGNKIVTGIGMLLHQARLAFQAWHSVMPEVTDELKMMVLR